MLAFLSNLFFISFFSALFIVFGIFVLFGIFKVKTLHEQKFLKLGASYFVGLAVFLNSWQILSKIIGLRFGIYVLTLAVIIVIIKKWNRYIYPELVGFKKEFRLLTLLILLLLIVGTVKALTPLPDYYLNNADKINPFSGLGGVGHSFRAANLSLYFVEKNYIPVLNQNVGQSLLASIQMFCGFINPQLSLILWLNVTLGMALVFSYGLLAIFIKETNWRVFSCFLLFVGGPALSLSYVSVTDTGSTLILSNNLNTIISVFIFMVFLLYLFDSYNKKINFKTDILFFVWFGFSGNMFGAQNILLAILVLLALLYKNRKEFATCSQTIFYLSIFLLGSIFGALFGGMLVPKFMISNVVIPGVMTIYQTNEKPVSFRFPRLSEGDSESFNRSLDVFNGRKKDDTLPLINNELSQNIQSLNSDSLKYKIKNNYILFALVRIFRSIQLIFYPLLALIVFKYIQKKDAVLNSNLLLSYLFEITCILFTVGVVVSSVFSVYGYYWELSRFLYVGIFLSMFFVALVFSYLIKNCLSLRRFKEASFWLVLCVFILLGPFLEYFIVDMVGNFVLPYKFSTDESVISTGGKTILFTERFKILLDFNKIIGKQSL